MFHVVWYGVCSPKVLSWCVSPHGFAPSSSRHRHCRHWGFESTQEEFVLVFSQGSNCVRIRVISISLCDVFFRVGASTNAFSWLGDITVPASRDACFRCGCVKIFVAAMLRASILMSSSVFGVAISGGSWRCWRGSSFPIGGPADAVHMQFRKSEMGVSSSFSGLVVRSFILGCVLADVVMFPLGLILFAFIAVRDSWSNVCCNLL